MNSRPIDEDRHTGDEQNGRTQCRCPKFGTVGEHRGDEDEGHEPRDRRGTVSEREKRQQKESDGHEERPEGRIEKAGFHECPFEWTERDEPR